MSKRRLAKVLDYASDPAVIARLPANTEWIRMIMRKYSLTPEDYKVLLDAQDGKCSICKQLCKSGKRLCVDHDHETGQIRALLCSNCNSALGLFNDDRDLLLAAAEYLKNHQR